jgi:hypothetical protein
MKKLGKIKLGKIIYTKLSVLRLNIVLNLLTLHFKYKFQSRLFCFWMLNLNEHGHQVWPSGHALIKLELNF